MLVNMIRFGLRHFKVLREIKLFVFGVFLKSIELGSSAFQASEHIAQMYAEMRNTEASQ
jgi:hypothetical protein